MKKQFSPTDFRKIFQYHISSKSAPWSSSYSMRKGARTDRHDEANSRFYFRNFANAPKSAVQIE